MTAVVFVCSRVLCPWFLSVLAFCIRGFCLFSRSVSMIKRCVLPELLKEEAAEEPVQGEVMSV